MSRIKKLFSSETAFVLIVTTIGLLLSLFPMLYELLRRNDIFPDRMFVLVYNFAPDYNAYLSKIVQGIQGHFLVREYFTFEPHQGSLLQIFYLMVGRIGSIFSQNPEFSYHLSRIVFGLGWILSGWWFICFSFSHKLYRKLAFLLFVFGGNWPKIVPDQMGYGFSFLGLKWEQTMVGWSNLDPVRRMTFIPHWNAGHVCTVISLLFLIKFFQSFNYSSSQVRLGEKSENSNIVLDLFHRSRTINLVLSIIFGIFAGLILPPTLIIVYAIVGMWVVWRLLIKIFQYYQYYQCPILPMSNTTNVQYPIKKDKKIGHWKLVIGNWSLEIGHWFIGILIFFVLTFSTLIYNLWITQIYPWKALVETDLFVNKIVFPYWDYLTALGPVGFMGLAGAFLVLFLKKEKYLWSSFWVLGMFSLIILFDKVLNWHDQTRFLEVGPELPLAILSVVFLSFIFSVSGKLKNYLMVLSTIMLMIVAVFLFTVSIKAQNDFIDHKILGSYPPLSFGNYVVYPVKTVMSAIDWIKENTTEKDVILSGNTTGNHVVPYAGRFVYIGHGSQTVRYYQEKMPNMVKFYQGKMEDAQSLKFLKQNRITYVFYGPEEKTFGYYPLKADYLTKVFENKDVVIYKINDK